MTAFARVVYTGPRQVEPLLLVRGDEVAVPERGRVIGRWVRFVCARPCDLGPWHGPMCTVLVLHGSAPVHADGASLWWCRTPRAVT